MSARAQSTIDTFYCDEANIDTLPQADSVYSVCWVEEGVLIVLDYYDEGRMTMKRSYAYSDSCKALVYACQDPKGLEQGEFCWYDKKGQLTDHEIHKPWLYKEEYYTYFSKFKHINWRAVQRKNGSLSMEYYRSGQLKTLVFLDTEYNYIGQEVVLSRSGKVKRYVDDDS